MKWHVYWTSRGDRMLQNVIDVSKDPDEVVIAAEHMERLLEMDPFDVGESRAEDDRILIQGSFAALFRVYTDDQIVAIHTFWRWAK